MYDDDDDDDKNDSNDSRDLDLIKDLHDQYTKDDAAEDTKSDRSEVDDAWEDAASEGSN